MADRQVKDKRGGRGGYTARHEQYIVGGLEDGLIVVGIKFEVGWCLVGTPVCRER